MTCDPATQIYPVEEVMLDLLHTAAKVLVIGGRLAYLIPTTYDFTVDDLPKHPCLTIESISEQSLSSRHGRRCVVLVKTDYYYDIHYHAFGEYKKRIMSGEDTGGFPRLKIKLDLALSAAAVQNDAVVKQVSKSSKKRREGRAKQRDWAQQQSLRQAANTENDVHHPEGWECSDST